MRTGEIRNQELVRFGKPLDGVRVLAAEQMQALPYATRFLAQLGAEVVKVEHPLHGESGRAGQPAVRDADGRQVGATYLRNNLSKQSIGIDLKQARGRELFVRLLPHFDVVCENMTPGTMARLGLDYATLAQLEPRLVYLSISGFGHLAETPYASWPAYAPMVEAMAGLYEPPRRAGELPRVVQAGALGDNASALFAVIGVLAALRHRESTGVGQHVDISMFDAMLAMADMVPNLWSLGAPPHWAAGGSLGIVAAFRADDGYFVLSVLRRHHFERLADVLGHPEWKEDERFATLQDQAEMIEPVVRPAVEDWARGKSRLEACRELCAQGVAAGPSNRAEDIRADPHVAARHMLIELPRPDADEPILVVGNPVKLSRMAEGPHEAFPRLGQHTDRVLRETLGLNDDELARLRAERVI